jgi:hypothetical protein
MHRDNFQISNNKIDNSLPEFVDEAKVIGNWCSSRPTQFSISSRTAPAQLDVINLKLTVFFSPPVRGPRLLLGSHDSRDLVPLISLSPFWNGRGWELKSEKPRDNEIRLLIVSQLNKHSPSLTTAENQSILHALGSLTDFGFFLPRRRRWNEEREEKKGRSFPRRFGVW